MCDRRGNLRNIASKMGISFGAVQSIPKLISRLRGTQYGNNEDVIEAENEYLGGNEKATYFKGIRKHEQRWAKCIALKGDSIER